MFSRFDDIFATCGWRVITLKHGKLQKAAFKRAGGKSLEEWIDACPNAEYAALTYQGGTAWRERLLSDIGDNPQVATLIASYTDHSITALMTTHGSHCLETLTDAFASAAGDVPTMFIAYTIKGFGLPFADHRE